MLRLPLKLKSDKIDSGACSRVWMLQIHYSEALARNRKIECCGGWVLSLVSDANNAARVSMARILREVKNSKILGTVVTSDEKWIDYDNSTRKRQWLTPQQWPPRSWLNLSQNRNHTERKQCFTFGGIAEESSLWNC